MCSPSNRNVMVDGSDCFHYTEVPVTVTKENVHSSLGKRIKDDFAHENSVIFNVHNIANEM